MTVSEHQKPILVRLAVKDTNTMSTNPKPICRFLELPAELRNRIYELVLVKEKPKLQCFLPPTIVSIETMEKTQFIQQPALTRTCSQIRQESLPVFYGGNIFFISCLRYRPLIKWLAIIGAKNRSMLRQAYQPLIFEKDKSDSLPCSSEFFKTFGDSVAVPHVELVEPICYGSREFNKFNRVTFTKPSKGRTTSEDDASGTRD